MSDYQNYGDDKEGGGIRLPKFPKGVVYGILAIVFVLVISFILYGVARSYRTTAVEQEVALSAQYVKNQNELSTYQATFYESIGVANLKSAQMDRIYQDAVKGRYEGKGEQGKLFLAVTEAYPNVDLKIYDKIVEQIVIGRTKYKNQQNKLLSMLETYDSWRNKGLLRPILLDVGGVPTDNLKARIGEQILTREAALDKMWMIVLTSDTKRAYETGTQDPLEVPQPLPQQPSSSPS